MDFEHCVAFEEALRLELQDLLAIENRSACWNISKLAQIEHFVQEQAMKRRDQAPGRRRLRHHQRRDEIRHLLNVLISFLSSVFFWQPLSFYLLTWMKIWAFHNGLMEESVYNLGLFLCCYCAKSRKHKINKSKSMLEFARMNSNTQDGKGKKKQMGDFAHYVTENSEMYDRELSISGSGFAALGNEDITAS